MLIKESASKQFSNIHIYFLIILKVYIKNIQNTMVTKCKKYMSLFQLLKQKYFNFGTKKSKNSAKK